MKVALAQAKQGRLHILGEMASALTAPRPELSDFAPRLITIKIHPDKIREVIGKGGSVIQAITKETGTQIDIQDDGTLSPPAVLACLPFTPDLALDALGTMCRRHPEIVNEQGFTSGFHADRKSVVEGKGVSVRVNLGGRR